jgi:hypothetical protein
MGARAGALQAGGHRFDRGWLHSKKCLQTGRVFRFSLFSGGSRHRCGTSKWGLLATRCRTAGPSPPSKARHLTGSEAARPCHRQGRPLLDRGHALVSGATEQAPAHIHTRHIALHSVRRVWRTREPSGEQSRLRRLCIRTGEQRERSGSPLPREGLAVLTSL